MDSEVDKKKPLFRDLAADDELETSQIESLCMACGETVGGHTRPVVLEHNAARAHVALIIASV